MKRMDEKNPEITTNIEASNAVLKEAWKNHAPQMSEKMGEIGKPVGERFLRRQWELSTDVPRTNILRRFKQFWGGSYLTRIKSGEIIFADLAYFRSLFLPQQIADITLEQSFFRVNDLWYQAQKAFFAREMVRFGELLLPLTQEIFALRRMLAQRERAQNHESLLKSIIRRIIGKFRAR